MAPIRRHERTGRPLGNEDFVTRVVRALDRILRKQKPGPKGKEGEKGITPVTGTNAQQPAETERSTSPNKVDTQT